MACLLALVGCDRPDSHDHPQLTTGEELYNHHCASCHRPSGDGAVLEGIPAVKYTSMKISEIVDQIRGHERTDDSKMPRYTRMSTHEARRIAVYVRLELRGAEE